MSLSVTKRINDHCWDSLQESVGHLPALGLGGSSGRVKLFQEQSIQGGRGELGPSCLGCGPGELGMDQGREEALDEPGEGGGQGKKKAGPLTHDGHSVSQVQGEVSEGLTQEQTYPYQVCLAPSQ